MKKQTTEWSEDILQYLDDDITILLDKYIAKYYLSEDGYLFFEEDAMLDRYLFALDVLQSLIKDTYNKPLAKRKEQYRKGGHDIQLKNNWLCSQSIRVDEHITDMINDETCPTCDQHPYGDTDDMCPVCGRSIGESVDVCPKPSEVGTVRISIIDDEKDAILNREVSLDFPFTINGNELWVFEGDENKAKTNLGIN